MDADAGVDVQNSSLGESEGDSETENGEDGQQKKKHKKEKVGFRDRKV